MMKISPDQRKFLGVLVKILITAGLLVAVFSNVQLSRFWTAFQKINKVELLLCVFFFGLSCVFRAVMWRTTTSRMEKVGISVLFGGVIVGYMANNILPFRAGEIVRTYYLSSRTKISASAALSTVFIERMFDVFSLALMLLIGIAYGMTGLKSQTAKVTLASLGVVIFALPIMLAWVARWNGLADRRGRFFAQISMRLDIFVKTLAQLKESRMIFGLLMMSMGAWLSNYLSVVFLVHGSLSRYFEAALILLLFINIGLLIPSSPGALGVMQVAFLFALSPFGIAREDALALSFAYQAGLYLFTLSIGLPYFMKTNLRLSGIRGLSKGKGLFRKEI